MVYIGRDLKDHLAPTPLPWAGTPSTRPGHSKPHPAWPWILPEGGIHNFVTVRLNISLTAWEVYLTFPPARTEMVRWCRNTYLSRSDYTNLGE